MGIKDHSKGAFYSGTSGLVLPVPNKEHYPAEFKDKSRLEYYASLFNSIEINSSFYKVPMAATVRKWADSVPENFRFTFKMWRDITHTKGLSFQEKDVFRFMETINHAGNKKGCLLIQFPPGLKVIMFSRMEQLLKTVAEASAEQPWNIALEFRHPSWYHDEVYALAEQFSAEIVVHDKPLSQTPVIDSPAAFKYLRFHGPNGDYKGQYPDDFLLDNAELLNEWRSEGKDVFCYFNNTVGDAIQNLTDLNTFVANNMG
jgi:uncharacterized protein YecE (DUF72 family)